MVLTSVMVIGPLINTGLSATSSLVIQDLEITASQFGFLTTACFAVSALGSLWLGSVSDRISGRLQILIILGGAALGLLMAALASSYLLLVAAVAVAGLAQAMSNPTTNRLIVLHVEPRKQPGWIGIKQSGSQGSQLLAGLLFPPVAVLVGWQGAAAAAAALAVLVLAWSWNQLPEEQPRNRRRTKVPRPAGPRSAALQERPKYGARVWLYCAQSAAASIGLTATNVYLPLFAHRSLDFSIVLAGLTSGLVGLVGVTARIFWSRRIAAGGRADSLLLVLAIGSVMGGLMLLFAEQSHLASLLWAGVVLHAIMALGVNVVIMAGMMRDVPASTAGGATGIVSLGMFFGIAAGPLAMGLFVDSAGGFFSGWLFVVVVNVFCVLLALVLKIRGDGVIRAT